MIFILFNLASTHLHSPIELFEEYNRIHGRSYSSQIEFMTKLEIFNQNLANVSKPFDVKSLSPYMDLTEYEFKEKYLSSSMNSFPISNLEIFSSKLVDIPDSVNYADQGVVTPVKTQGSCGACWAFATISVIETQTMIVNNVLESLSEQQLVDCDNANTDCDGGWIDMAFIYIIKAGGVMKGVDYPYIEKQGRCKFIPEEVAARVESFYAISQDEAEILKVVAEKGTVAIVLNAGPLQFYKRDDVVSGENCDPKNLNHAVVIVGYKDVIDQGIRKPVWIVRNSWGPGFGNDGYFYILRNVGACGLNKKPFIGFVQQK